MKEIIRFSSEANVFKRKNCPECGQLVYPLASMNKGLFDKSLHIIYSCNCGCVWREIRKLGK